MSILGRYLVRTYLGMVSTCLGAFVAIYLVVDFLERYGKLSRTGGTLPQILGYFLCKIPEMISQTAPMAVLMGTILAMGALSRSSEITAMRSSGISLGRIALPLVMLGVLASLLLLGNAEFVVPRCYEQMERVERVAIRKQGSNAVFKRNNIWFRSDSMILQAQLFDPPARMLKGVIVWNLDATLNPVSRIDAERAEYRNGTWTLHNLEIKDFSRGRGYLSTRASAMDSTLNLRIDDLKVLDNNADNLSFRKLREYAASLKNGGYPAHRYLAMMHAKLAVPCAAFVMVILGIPFAMRNSRSGGIALGIGASIAIGFAYFVAHAVLMSYGRSGVLPPLLAAWGANLLFAAGGIWLTMSRKE